MSQSERATAIGATSNPTVGSAGAPSHGNPPAGWIIAIDDQSARATSVGYNNETVASPDSTVIGNQSKATNAERATAVGYMTQATAEDASAFGNQSVAGHAQSTAIGYMAQTSIANEVAIGQAVGGMTQITAGGVWDHTGNMTTDKMVTVGPDGHVRSVAKEDTVDQALGYGPDGKLDVLVDDATIKVNGANQLYVDTTVLAKAVTECGMGAQVGGGGLECGTGADTTGGDATSSAVGSASKATAPNASAFGANANAATENSLTLGAGSMTTLDPTAASAAYDGVVFGNNVSLTEGTDAAGEANLGNRLVTEVADGSSDTVNGHQLHQVASIVDSNGDRITKNEGDIIDLDNRVTVNEGNIADNRRIINQHTSTLNSHEMRITTLEGRLDREVDRLDDRINESAALSAALQAPYVERNRRFAIRRGLGQAGGAVGLAASAALRMNSHWQIDAGVSVGTKTGLVVTANRHRAFMVN